MQFRLPFPRDGTSPKLKLRRRVFRLNQEPKPDGSYLFKAKSFSSLYGVEHRCRVNPRTGYVTCSCRDFKFRMERFHPNYWEGPVCKHLRRAIRTVRKLERLREQHAPTKHHAYVA